MRHLISILLLLVLAVPAAADGYLPEHCAKLEHPPPDFFECPSPYVEMTRSGKGKIFSRAWHCRETKHSLGVNRYGGCGGSKGLAMFPGWTVPVAAATAKPPQVDLSLVCKEYPSPTVSYRTPAQIRRIARDTVKSMGLKVGPLDVLPTDKKRQWYWAASGFSGLNVLSRNMDWTWFVDGDTVRFRKRSDTSQVRIYKTLDARLQIADSNMEVEIETDFPATTEITIATERVYERKDPRRQDLSLFERILQQMRDGCPMGRQQGASHRRSSLDPRFEGAPGQLVPARERHGIRDRGGRRPYHRVHDRRSVSSADR